MWIEVIQPITFINRICLHCQKGLIRACMYLGQLNKLESS